MELKKYKLGNIADIINGATPSTQDIRNYDGNIIWITPKDLSDQKTKRIRRGQRNITIKGFNSCSAQMIPPHNILMSSRAPIGLLAINENECCTNQGFKNLVINKSICDVDYIYYYLKFHIKEIESLGSGTTFKEVSKSSLYNFELSLPSIENQRNISKCLSDLDQKIELNRQINDNLEAMAKQLYDYWFVQFDFPNEEGKPYKSSGGALVWNEKLKREIPQEWSYCKLKDFINLFDSKRVPLSSKDRGERQGVYPYYGATGIMDYVNDYIFDGDYILLAEDGSTSDAKGFPIVQYIWGKNWVNNHAHIILPKNERSTMFTYQMLRSIPAKQIETGSIQKKISQENLCGYKMVLPNSNLLEKYENVVSPLWEKRKRCIEEINTLTRQRDELLPLLMNGQASVNYHLSAFTSFTTRLQIHAFTIKSS